MGINDRDYMRRDYIPKQARKVPRPTKGMPYWRIMILGLLLTAGGLGAVVWLGKDKGGTKSKAKPRVVEQPSKQQVQTPPQRLDVNSATYEELRSIPFMTNTTVNSLIKLRPFKEWEELDQVYGIGPKRLGFLQDYLFLKESPDTKGTP